MASTRKQLIFDSLSSRRAFLSTAAASSLLLPAAGRAAQSQCAKNKQSTTKSPGDTPSNTHIKYKNKDHAFGSIRRGYLSPHGKKISISITSPDFFMRDRERFEYVNFHPTEIYPSARVSCGQNRPLELGAEPVNLDHLKFRDLLTDRMINLETWLGETETDGWLVLYLHPTRGPLRVMETYANGLDVDRTHAHWSVSKSLVGSMISHGLAERKFANDSIVADVLTDLKGTPYEQVTLSSLKRMLSGIIFYDDEKKRGKESPNLFEGLAAPGEVIMRNAVAYGTAVGQFDSPEAGKASAVGDIAFRRSGKRVVPPDTAFIYNEVDVQTAARMLETVYGQPFPELFSRKMWSQIGAAHDASVLVDPFRVALASGGFSTTLQDLGRWGLAHLPGSPNCGAVAPKHVAELLAMNKPRRIDPKWEPDSFREPEKTVRRYLNVDGGYENFTWIYPRGRGFMAAGFGGQYCYVDVPRRVVIAKMSTFLGIDDYVPVGPAFARIADEVAAHFEHNK